LVTSSTARATASASSGTQSAVSLFGSMSFTVCGVMFAELLDGVLDHEDVARLDRPVTAYVAGHRTDALTLVFRVLTTIGSAAVLIPLTLGAAAVLAWRSRAWRPLWIVAVTLTGSQLLVFAIKLAVARPRPATIFAVITANGYSFPSGHATSSLAALGIVAWLAGKLRTSLPVRLAIWAAALAVAAGIGLSRIWLGVHYLSDVLAAWVLGAAWLTVVITTITASTHLRTPHQRNRVSRVGE
jgi:membrane-associated phospholipid phosphatase